MKLKPMSTFDPATHCYLYDGTNDWMMEWKPEYAEGYQKWAEPWGDDPRFMHFDGLLLGGWSEQHSSRTSLRRCPPNVSFAPSF